jgi:polysaccharide biosynthesis transport protein
MPTTTLALSESPPPSGGLNVNDLIFILYRHKLKILLFLLLGIAAAVGVFVFLPAPYESQAKLLVRYVVDRSAIDGTVGESAKDGEGSPPVGAPSEAILNSEVEILTSSDLDLQVAEAIGPARILAGSPKEKITLEGASIAIKKATEVAVVKDSNIISITYSNKDGKLAEEVLGQIVKRYLEKHLEVHRSVGGYEFVSQEAGKLRIELDKTESELKGLKEKYGVTTIAESIKATGDEITKTQTDIDTTQTDLATQKVSVAEIDKFYHGADLESSGKAAAVPEAPDSEIVNRYQALVERVTAMRIAQTALLAKYSAESKMVKPNQLKLDTLEKQKVALEKKYPALITVAVAGSGETAAATSSANEIILARARLAGLETHASELQLRLKTLQLRLRALNDVAPRITELERTKDVQESSYRYYGASLEKARVDSGLNPARMPNINVVQNPSPAMRSLKDSKKVLLGLVGGGLIGGLGLAMLIELVLDRTVKRSRELETRLRIPLMLTIPDFGGRLRLLDTGDGEEASVETSGEYLRPFCEAIRDRLGLFFELNNLAHKPKLVAVTGLSENAGVSTLAAGLADVLTEGGEGKVLLINKPVNPKRFYSLMKEFKVSELDYVIFDMPSLGDTSATLPMAGFMDKVLLVVEAEKSGRDSVKRAYEQLSAKTDVSVIFNKSRIYGPKWLEGEI